MTFLKQHWQATAVVVIAALLTIFGWRMFSQSAQIIDLGIFMLLGTALMLMPIAGLAEQILRKLGEPTAAALPCERTRHQEPEPPMTQHTCGSNGCSHASDCAVHNQPAMPAGPCDCGTRVPGALESKAYADGTTATGPGPLPELSPAEQSIEAEIQAQGKTAPRVTPDDIQREIVSEHYHSPIEAGDQAWTGETNGALDTLTFCVLVLRNGFKVVGINYGAIDPAQHDAARGRQEARAQAVEKVWELLGFRLRDKLAAGA